MIWFYPDNTEIAGKWVLPQYWNSQQPLSEWYDITEKYLSTYCRSFSMFYEFILGKSRHFCIPIWRKRTISMISHSEEPVAHFNITNLHKSAEEFLPDKKARPDLNLQAIDFSLIPLKLRPDRSKMWKHKKIHVIQRGCCEFQYCANHIFLRFQYCLDESIS